MTKATFSALFAVTILLSAAFVASFGMEQAYALKSTNNVHQKLFGPKTISKICGLQMCYDVDNVKIERTKTMIELKTKSMPMYESKSKP